MVELQKSRIPQGSEPVRVLAGYLEGVMLELRVDEATPRSRPEGFPSMTWGKHESRGGVEVGLVHQGGERDPTPAWGTGGAGSGHGGGGALSPAGLVVLVDLVASALWLKGEPTPACSHHPPP